MFILCEKFGICNYIDYNIQTRFYLFLQNSVQTECLAWVILIHCLID